MTKTRRDFLKAATAVGAVAASAATPSTLSARTYRRLVGANERIQMAIIGTGGMGGGHLHAFCDFAAQGTPLDLVAVCDVCKPRLDGAQAAATEKQEGRTVAAYRHHADLLAQGGIDATLIAAPEHQHSPIAIDALNAGKHVYVEKPMTLRLDQAFDLQKTAHAHPDAVFTVGTQKMALPKYREAKRLIREGAIGKPTWSQTGYCRNSLDGEWNYYGIDPDVVPGEMLDWDAWLGHLGPREFDTLIYHRWRRYKDFSTGIIGDLLVHQITPLLSSLDVGWPVRVDAVGGHYIDKAMENHDQVNLVIQFEKDHTMTVAGSTCNEIGPETMIRGHEGTVYLNSRNCVIKPERIYQEEHEPITVECPEMHDHTALRKDWLDSIREARPSMSPVDFATQVMVIVDLATRSLWEGGAFAFDPKTKKVSKL